LVCLASVYQVPIKVMNSGLPGKRLGPDPKITYHWRLQVFIHLPRGRGFRLHMKAMILKPTGMQSKQTLLEIYLNFLCSYLNRTRHAGNIYKVETPNVVKPVAATYAIGRLPSFSHRHCCMYTYTNLCVERFHLVHVTCMPNIL
jgi:hypothetical protein